MSEDIPLSVIQKTQSMLGLFVKKPALTEKLLRKPPFRFLHDIIVAVQNDHGVLEGLYTPKELVSDNVKDKESKMAFLQKLIDVLGYLEGSPLKVKASRIVAGQEAERTNALLQSLATILAQKTDTKDAIHRVLEGKATPNSDKAKTNALADSNKTSTNKTKTPSTSSLSANKSQEPAPKKSDPKKLDSKVAAKKPTGAKLTVPGDKKVSSDSKTTGGPKSKSSSRSPSRERVKTPQVVQNSVPSVIPKSSQLVEHVLEPEISAKEKKNIKETPLESKEDEEKERTSFTVVQDQRAEQVEHEAKDAGEETEGIQDSPPAPVAGTLTNEVENSAQNATEVEEDQHDLHTSSTGKRTRQSARPASRLGRVNSGVAGRATPAVTEAENGVVPDRASAKRPATNKSMHRLESTLEEPVVVKSSSSPTRPVPLSPPPEPEVLPPRPPSTLPPQTRPLASARPRSSRRPPSRAGHFSQQQLQASLLEETSTIRPVTGKVANVILEGDVDDEEPELAVDSEPTVTASSFPRTSLNDDPELQKQHGLLVDQILQVQRQTEPTTEDQSASTWRLDGEAWKREMERARTQVQQLTRLALPLGQNLAYLQEDLEVAQEEARRWAELVRTYQQQLQDLSRIKTTTTPLEVELQAITANVEEARSRLHLLQASVYGNEEKLRQLLITSR